MMDDKRMDQIEKYTGDYDYLNLWQLHRLGWSSGYIRAFLGDPDGGGDYGAPYGGPRRWSAERVERIRSTLPVAEPTPNPENKRAKRVHTPKRIPTRYERKAVI